MVFAALASDRYSDLYPDALSITEYRRPYVYRIEIFEISEIALSLCEEILAFLLRVPRWIQRLVALAVQRFAVGPQGHIRSWCSLQLNVTDQAGR